ncbi:MAG: hypothetical protein GY815_07240 [Gammaproteobacteria bacterium]|nr:hypothetical protein [Gammaproteobacteria bacterium]
MKTGILNDRSPQLGARCNKCHRLAPTEAIGDYCGFLQPDNSYCAGAFEAQKKSNGSAVNHQEQVQTAADRRSQARRDIGYLIKCLSPKEMRLEPDVPEGKYPINLSVSRTLAAQWVESLKIAMRQL